VTLGELIKQNPADKDQRDNPRADEFGVRWSGLIGDLIGIDGLLPSSSIMLQSL
jgi:hypothetical protein